MTSEPKRRSGGCLCGAIQFELRGEPFLFGLCHCTDCRKESGSVFTAYAKWRLDQASLKGQPSAYRGRSFCPTCGSRLYNLNADHIEVRIGSLDEAPSTIGTPSQEGWTRRRESWLHPVAGAGRFAEDTDR
jgi:hypothetical protein